MNPEAPPVEAWSAALATSHRRLASVVAALSADEVAGPSYDNEWSIAHVLSHLGSGAEIFALFLRAGLNGEPAPGPDAFKPVWERWDARSPEDQAAESLVADRAFLDRLGSLDGEQQRAWHLSMFGADHALGDLLRLRLGEHALHTWDIDVMRDAAAVIAPDAVDLLVDRLDQIVSRAHHDPDRPLRLMISTSGPSRRFLLVADSDGTRLVEPGGSIQADRVLSLPGEAWIRLVYGRLDPLHTPDVDGDPSDLDALRQLFPGV
jgi:uncharacterized protein (TIGR03083 family)